MKILHGIGIGLSITCCILNIIDVNIQGALGWFTSALWQLNYAISN